MFQTYPCKIANMSIIFKNSINTYFVEKVLSSKTAPPAHVLVSSHALTSFYMVLNVCVLQAAFVDFFGVTVELADVESTFLPAMEKSLIRTPDGAIPVVAAFFSAISLADKTSPALLSRLIPPLLSSAKAVSPSTRSAALHLFTVLFSSADTATLAPLLEQVSTPLKTAKTSSPDHRASLFSMLSVLPPSPTTSSELVAITLSLLPKETNDHAFSSMMSLLAQHLRPSLVGGTPVSAPHLAALIKGMQEAKASIRRMVFLTIGKVLWSFDSDGDKVGAEAKKFGEGLLPGFEGALKTVSSNPLNASAGSLEGYVALAILKGRLGRWAIPSIGT